MIAATRARPRLDAGSCSPARTGRRLLVSVEDVVQEVNRFSRGWSGNFRYGNSDHSLQDQPIRHRPPCAVRRQAPQTRLGVRHEGRGLPVAQPARADQPQRNHRRATAQPAVAIGALNATGEERRGAVCGKIACTVRCRRREETRPVG
ncbi:MAG: hypothetical protein JOZ98_09525 [Solirubrobacterales bacterium]|nr:hypothetical protein [Solirubrobacterales bacterium]